MSKKIFIGNLPFKVRGKELREAFERFGEIEDAIVVLDKFDSRKSKGFGFISFIEDADADKAVAEMNEKDFKGRPLTVNIANPREERLRRPRHEGGRDNRREESSEPEENSYYTTA